MNKKLKKTIKYVGIAFGVFIIALLVYGISVLVHGFWCQNHKEVPQEVIKYHTQQEVETLFEGYMLPEIEYSNTIELYDNYYVTSFVIKNEADTAIMSNLIRQLQKDKPVQMDYEKNSGVSYTQVSKHGPDSMIVTRIVLDEHGLEIYPEQGSLLTDNYAKPFISLGCPLPSHTVLMGDEDGATILFDQPLSKEWLTKLKQNVKKKEGWNCYEEAGRTWRGFYTDIIVSNNDGMKTYFSCTDSNKVYTYAFIICK